MTAPAPSLSLDKLAKGVTEVPGVEELDRRHWSVTTLLNYVGDANGLIGWAANQAAEAGIKHKDTWQSIEQSSGTLEALKWVAAARWRAPKGESTSAELGSAVHAACEEYAMTGQRPKVTPEVQPFLDRFDEWLQVWTPRYLATEVSVFSPTYGYAGTLDAIFELHDPQLDEWVPLINDYKTSREGFDRRGRPKTPFPEVALQLAAYRYADLAAVARVRRFEERRRRYYLLNEWEKEQAVPVPKVHGGGVLQITPDHCDFYPVRCDEEIFDAFLASMDVARFFLQTAGAVIGSPLVKP